MNPSSNGNGHVASLLKNNGIDGKEYQKQINIIKDHGGGNFMLLHQHHARYLKGDGDAVIVLCYLLNLLRMKDCNASDRERLMKNGMWFCCPAKDIQTDMGMWDGRQRRALEKLVCFDLVKTKRMKGNVTWVQINTETLTAVSENDGLLLEKRAKKDAEETRGKPQKSGSNVSRKAEVTFLETLDQRFTPPEESSASPCGNGTCKEPADPSKNPSENPIKELPAKPGERVGSTLEFSDNPDMFCEKAASTLTNAMKRKGLMAPMKYVYLPAAAKHIRMLVERDGVPWADVDRLVKWYSVNMKRDRWTPVIYEIKQFRSRYATIKEAMQRDENGKRDRGQQVIEQVLANARIIATASYNPEDDA